MPHRARIPGLALDVAALPWRATRVPGVAWIPLHLASDRGPRGADARAGGTDDADATVLIRMDPGCGYPPHRHEGVEEVVVLAGGYRDATGSYRAGDYVRYAGGSGHAPVALEGGPCVLLASARGGIALGAEPEPEPEPGAAERDAEPRPGGRGGAATPSGTPPPADAAGG